MLIKQLIKMTVLGLSCGALNTGWCDTENNQPKENLASALVENITAYIPPQCYTKTQDEQGEVYNPCYSCHTKNDKPNFLDDSDVQLSFALPGPALTNPWSNLFKDRQAEVARISDAEVLEYIRGNNYLDANQRIVLADKLTKSLPTHWDFGGDGIWEGYVPDAYFNFDQYGLDRTPDGEYTGWRAFAYYPFLGTFWPTNGSTDDVLIRLAPAFWHNENGEKSLEVYDLNLAIIQALVTRKNVSIDSVDERVYGVDLDKNGQLNNANQVVFDWAPVEDRLMSYVGQAKQYLEQGKVHLAAGLFPEGTEFLHSVRYLDVAEGGKTIRLAARMKELRYARKTSWYNYSELKGISDREGFEREVNADATKAVPGNYEQGMFTQGWLYQGFIEDRNGDLRPQSQEETLFCMGCHGGVGATTDTIFSYPRKFSAETFQKGWYHWSQKGMQGIAEPKRRDGRFEYSYYLEVNRSGNEFRSNDEIQQRFFDANRQLKPEMIEALHNDISTLLVPSPERALTLNKAYWTIVKEQSYTQGRDATVSPQANVHQSVEQGLGTGIDTPVY